MMAIQILSDLHLESPKSAYDVFEIQPKAPYLALLGDVGNVADPSHTKRCLGFLTRQLRQFRAVLFVPGNHEAYHSNWEVTLDILRTFQEDTRKDRSLGEFILLDRGVFRVPDSNTVILGCSLFSNIPPERRLAVTVGVYDFLLTKHWGVNVHNEMHDRDLSWLNTQVADLEGEDVKILIFSHWNPTKDARALDPSHAGSKISSAFSTDLSREKCFKSDKVKLWAFGHTHYNCDFLAERADGAGPLRLVTNQRGYYFDQCKGFDGEKTVEV